MALFLPNNNISSYGYGGMGYASYGYSDFPEPLIAVKDGYGGAPYGTGPYGSTETSPPRVLSATALDGNRLEIFFSENIRDDSNFYDAANFTITEVLGAAVTVSSVDAGTKGNLGYTSLVLTHSGTTMGGKYEVQVQNLKDIAGNEIIPSSAMAKTTFLALRPTTTLTGSADKGVVSLNFNEGISNGGTTSSNYNISTQYPIVPTITGIAQAATSQIDLTTQGMTITDYEVRVGPTPAIHFDGVTQPSYTKTGNGAVEYNANGLLISKEKHDTLILYFPDENNPQKITPSSCYTANFVIDLSAPTIRPFYLINPVAEVFISDGAVEIALVFKQVNGVDVIEWISGTTYQVTSAWRSNLHDVTVVRNELYGFYALMVNGACILSVPTAQVTGVNVHGVGLTLSINPYYRVLLMPFRSMTFTSSQTVYTTSGNFIHNSVLNLQGESDDVQEVLLTKNGPLTKGWGDATPATNQDVEVRLNGTSIEVESVNPYIGAIKPKIPIPLMPTYIDSSDPRNPVVASNTTIHVDYKWLKTPVMSFAGLNTEGLTLNKWDRANHVENPLISAEPIGVPSAGRFPFGVVLPLLDARPAPKLVSHRYIGYQRDYSAVLNSPTTMMLNQDPNRVAIPDLEELVKGELTSFDGNSLASLVWSKQNTITEDVIGDGTVRTTGNGAFYQKVEYVFPKTTILAARFQIEEYNLFGVFTGVGFGVKTFDFLYFLGLLEINGVKHVGFLKNLDEPNEESSWEIGLKHSVDLISQTEFKILTSEYPTISSTATVRFQVLSGTQKGIYTVTEAINQNDGTTTVTVTPAFPANYTEYGNSPIEIYFEHLFQEFNQTYRMVVNTEDQAVEMYIGGAVSGLALQTTCTTKPIRAKDYFNFDEGVFWGTLGDQNTNKIRWSLFQYGTTPKYAAMNSRGLVVAEHFTNLPETWFVEGDYGQEKIEVDTLHLKSEGQYEYTRVEPFFKKEFLSDVDFTFRAVNGVTQVLVEDGERKILFQNLLYVETQIGTKSLLVLKEEFLNGEFLPQDVGWSESSEIKKFNAEYHLALSNKVLPAHPYPCNYTAPKFSTYKIFENPDGFGLFLEFRVKQVGSDAALQNFQVVIVQGSYTVQFDMTPTGFTLGSTSTVLHNEVFDHGNQFHTYKFILDVESDALVILIDAVVIRTLQLSPYAEGNVSRLIRVTTEQYCVLDWIAMRLKAPSTAKRTLGILRGTDQTNINDWEIPRTDNYPLPNNSSLSVIEEMDWRQKMDVRLHRDPTWGVTVYRTDLEPPPYYDASTRPFATETTDPSAGWINVEYDDLPLADHVMGRIKFGMIGIGDSYWNLFRYRLFLTAVEDFRSPHHMVLNQYNVLTSDELGNDITLEQVEVTSLSNKVVSLIPSNIFGHSVFVLTIEGTIAPSTTWSFDREAQTVFFVNPVYFDAQGKPRFDEIPQENWIIKEHYAAKLTFSPSEIRTKSYLQSQELQTSVTLLNKGTPPVPKSQIADAIREIVFGTGINIIQDVLNIDPDFYLNDPSKSIQFRNPDGALYEDLEFIEKSTEDNEPIEAACDDFNEIGIQGTSISDHVDTIKHFPQQIGHIFHASGGNYLGKNLGGDGLVLYPNAPSVPHTVGKGAVQRQCHVHLQMKSVVNSTVMGDGSITVTNTPLTETFSISDNGGCTGELVDYANLYSHVGPWGGMVALNQNSFLYGSNPSHLPSGIPSSGQGMTPQGGSPLPAPTITAITLP